MKTLGSILLVVGLLALTITGINYINDSKSFNLIGFDVTVSKGNIIPVLVSGFVFIVGLVLLVSRRK